MKKCKICSALNNDDYQYCHYCGYSINLNPPKSENERYALYCCIDNLQEEPNSNKLFSRKVLRIDNALCKRNVLFDKIKFEKEKIKNLILALTNVSLSENRKRIESIKDRMQQLVDELLKCRLDIEFVKIIGNIKVIKKYVSENNVEVIDVNKLLLDEQEEFNDWIKNVKDYYSSQSIIEFCDKKYKIFIKLKEEIALKMITGILSTTTLLQQNSENIFDNIEVSDIEKEIERINYEIDRLNGELTL